MQALDCNHPAIMPPADPAPPSKRPHISTEESPQVLAKDSELWYEDGTITLIARNIEFRVYRGPLARHSPFFRDMLSMPQPPAALQFSVSEPNAGCPVIHLTDSPEDLRHVLRVFTAGRGRGWVVMKLVLPSSSRGVGDFVGEPGGSSRHQVDGFNKTPTA